ncbi:YbaK/EbsC family protein [Marinactinospora thermotolerans]|uniref:Cys-tRNA(Pro) deacylase, prolyl-tRNA editing enzyme YbaK/EbsC n=1 Tax=Marinactinospora thermotolerans DSM 45154 TaxID=1122192 RepID=A0A1T4SEG9_9ACTN|nr:YbaK/EbsC family protein [Marinactinospora thermotolerans]SKA26567.1 Cys-tRNA(Pro) deacylase, prolyl-tRNA editing enzyme YbaK/EbsC [Marinactinospora thermotolerans DSM 45154]
MTDTNTGVFGGLETQPAGERPDLLAEPVARAVADGKHEGAAEGPLVAQIDPELADTAAFCAAYDIGLDASANCVVIAAKRGGETRFAACVVLATTRVDVNGVVRRHLGARKARFADQADAVSATGMEYGGITPLGLPDDWPILVDPAVTAAPWVVIGSGLRRSKLVVAGAALAGLPNAEVVEGLGRPVG